MATATASTYEQNRDYVLAVLRRRCGWLDHGEREAALHDAYLVLLQKQHDGELDVGTMADAQLRAYLVQTALHKALDERKRAGRQRERSLEDDALARPDPGAAPDEQAASAQASAQVREIVAQLDGRRQTIVKLRFFFERTPEEIQEYLGVSERVYRRELERAMRQIADSVELVRRDRYCDSRRGAILALVAGIAGPNRASATREHLASCPTCAHWAVAVRDSTRSAAALLPLPALAADGWGDRLSRLFDGIGSHLSHAKQHAVEVATRVDASSAGGFAAAARPGTLATVVAGCLAVGGGATYCVTAGIPEPLRAPLFGAAAHAERPAAKPRAARAAASATRPAPAPSLATTQTAPAPQAPRPARRPARGAGSAGRSAPAATPQAAAQEFGLEGSGQPVGGGATSASSGSAPAPSPAPAPAPSAPATAGSGEFDP